jgi:hypothetical protein
MGCCDGFFMGNSLSDPKDLLIPFIGTNPEVLLPVARHPPVEVVVGWRLLAMRSIVTDCIRCANTI